MPLLHTLTSILLGLVLLAAYLWAALRLILAVARFLPSLCRPIDRLPAYWADRTRYAPGRTMTS